MHFATAFKIVVVTHTLLILAVGGCVIFESYRPHAEGADLAWAIFLVLDFPLSIPIFMTSGPTVVSCPKFLTPPSFLPGWFFYDVIFPGFVFLIIGILNWMLLLGAINWFLKIFK